MGAALAEVDVPDFQPRQDVKIATDDSADSKVPTSNGVDDQRGIDLLIEKLKVSNLPLFASAMFLGIMISLHCLQHCAFLAAAVV